MYYQTEQDIWCRFLDTDPNTDSIRSPYGTRNSNDWHSVTEIASAAGAISSRRHATLTLTLNTNSIYKPQNQNHNP